VQAGVSEVGQRIAAQHCDAVFGAKQSLDDARGYYASLKGKMNSFNREPSQLLVMLGLTTIVGRTRQEAQDKFEQLETLIDPLVGLSLLYRSFGDLSMHPLDGPVPPPVATESSLRSSANLYYDLAQKNGWSIRQLYKKIGMAQEHKTITGTAQDIVDEMEAWIDGEAADGFNLTPTHLPHGIRDFAEFVIPELHRRGMFREEYEGSTLRENLGLPTPISRYSKLDQCA
jgi:alkanesulfonate monooxygenase SsuD/methylene tetrahydromethanopterin reductase-like flavin-dependent oxidoreductase (luciferase family)